MSQLLKTDKKYVINWLSTFLQRGALPWSRNTFFWTTNEDLFHSDQLVSLSPRGTAEREFLTDICAATLRVVAASTQMMFARELSIDQTVRYPISRQELITTGSCRDNAAGCWATRLPHSKMAERNSIKVCESLVKK
jgi:hypothetical protein